MCWEIDTVHGSYIDWRLNIQFLTKRMSENAETSGLKLLLSYSSEVSFLKGRNSETRRGNHRGNQGDANHTLWYMTADQPCFSLVSLVYGYSPPHWSSGFLRNFLSSIACGCILLQDSSWRRRARRAQWYADVQIAYLISVGVIGGLLRVYAFFSSEHEGFENLEEI